MGRAVESSYCPYNYQGTFVVPTWRGFESEQPEKVLDATISRPEHVWVGSKYFMALRKD